MYLYLKSKNYIPLKNINLIFEKIIKGEYIIEWNQKFGKITLIQDDSQIVTLKHCLEAINSDLQDELTIVVVPKYDSEIEQIVKLNKRTGLYYFIEELNKIISNDKSIVDKLLSFKEDISEDILDTVKVYIEQDMSINKTSRVLFTHRNTINYRITRFIEQTGIDIRLSINGYYVYMLITWC